MTLSWALNETRIQAYANPWWANAYGLCNILYNVVMRQGSDTRVDPSSPDASVLDRHARQLQDEFTLLARRWPRFSGRDSYPVPSCSEQTASAAYWCASMRNQLWDLNTEYGRARRDMLDWMVEQTSQPQP